MNSFAFDPTAYGPAIAALLTDRLPELGPGSPNESLRAALEAIEAPAACRAGLWLLHDFLDESHTISQDLHTADGSYWHGIMHRREPDPSNAKYWFRRVSDHPVFSRLVAESPSLGYAYRTPMEFEDFCEKVRGTESPQELVAKQIQLLEWRLLFDHCWAKRSPDL